MIATAKKNARLAELEAMIERDLKTFIKVGAALLEIRDSKLYLKDHRSFEDYCLERWNMSRQHAYRLIDAAEIASNLASMSPNGDTTMPMPTSETQTRPMAGLNPDAQRAAWQETVHRTNGHQPTEQDVRETVEAMTVEALAELPEEEQREFLEAEERKTEARARRRDERATEEDRQKKAVSIVRYIDGLRKKLRFFGDKASLKRLEKLEEGLSETIRTLAGV